MNEIYFNKDIDKFIVDIYVIGYEKKGESIYIRIKTLDGDYIKDILIDCYATNYNKTMDLLKELKKEDYINYICVSHYHDDHIKQIEKIIKKYSKKSTVILYPDTDQPLSLTDLANIVRNCIAERRTDGRKLYGSLKKISDPVDNIMSEELIYNTQKINIEIKAISPYSNITSINVKKDPKDVEQNDYSIALVLTIGQIKMFFTSDIMNNTINLIDNQGEVLYIKIPHHGSKDSDKILNKIKLTENTVCVCTNYKSSHLPNKEILDKYNSKTEKVYITDGEGIEDYGIINTRYIIDAKEGIIRYSTRCMNNSKKYKEENYLTNL